VAVNREFPPPTQRICLSKNEEKRFVNQWPFLSLFLFLIQTYIHYIYKSGSHHESRKHWPTSEVCELCPLAKVDRQIPFFWWLDSFLYILTPVQFFLTGYIFPVRFEFRNNNSGLYSANTKFSPLWQSMMVVENLHLAG
jgi:uncharacterized membrane protein